MKIQKTSENQLQVIVTKQDMFGRDMKSLFKDIIELAKAQFGFEVVNNTSLMVEAFPLSEESMILTVTKVDANELDFGFFTNEEAATSEDEPWAVFEFASLDDVIEMAHLVEEPFTEDSKLYKYEERFFLYIDDVNLIVEHSRGHIVEFGENTMYSMSFLDEHGQLMIERDALNILSKI